jgi:hypothetical protein
LFPGIFVNFCLQFRWPQLVWQSISCSTFSEFLYLDYYILISSRPHFYYIPIWWYCYISHKHVLSLFLAIMSGLFARTSLSVCTPWFHNSVVHLRSIADLGTCYCYYYYWAKLDSHTWSSRE